MKKIDYNHLETLNLDYALINLLNEIHEYRAKQSLYLKQYPEVLEKLKEVAMIQSTDASNKIEGIATTDGRLKQIMDDKIKPKNRNEEEIAGYRDVLKIIHENYLYIPMTENNLLTLHKRLYEYSVQPFRGNYKQNDNVVTQKDSRGNEFVRFQPAPAYLTPQLIQQLCEQWNSAQKEGKIDALLLIPCFILDFLSIHPFSDGNGRLSRLLILLLLYQNDYHVGMYISIEKVIEDTKDQYYEALRLSSIGWIDNKQDYTPFVHYLLSVILKAYRMLEERFEHVSQQTLTNEQQIIKVMEQEIKPMSRKSIESHLPHLSQRTIERGLSKLQKEGEIQKVGAGRSTKYRRNFHV